MTYGDLDTLAFNSCSAEELMNLDLGVTIEKTHGITNEDVLLSNLCDKYIDTNLPSSRTCCKTFSITEFQELKSRNNLKFFQNNINGSEMKHDLLQNFLYNSSIDFDVISIKENFSKTW